MQLHCDREKFERAGARLVVIGQGTPEQAADFVRSKKVDLTVLADTNREAYKAAGTKVATMKELLGPKVVLRAVTRALPKGAMQGKVIGHPAQLGGVLVIDRDGSVVWSHLGEEASDIPPNDAVLAAIPRRSAAA